MLKQSFMRNGLAVSLAISALLLMFTLLGVTPNRSVVAAPLAVFNVNHTSDQIDANPGNGVCETSTAGQCTLRAAIMEANALPGADTISVPAGTYNLIRGGNDDTAVNGDLDITSTLTISGAGYADTIISGQSFLSPDRIFHITGTVDVEIKGVTIKSGKAQAGNLDGDGGGLYNTNGRVTLNLVRVYTNTAFSRGGGIYNAGELTVTNNSLIEANAAETAGGGGIFNLNGRVRVLGSSLTGNHADAPNNGQGGGLGSTGDVSNVVTIQSSLINGNSAGYGGGGMWSWGGVVTVTGVQISDNQGGDYGGGLYATFGARLSMNSTSFYDNAATWGGGLSLGMSTTTSINSIVFSSNQGQRGAGLAMFNQSRLSGENVTLLGNFASERGGGVSISAGAAASFNEGYMLYNWASATDGGGLEISTGGHVTVSNNLIGNNSAARHGGGFYLNGGTASVTNTAIYSNVAQAGGGLYVQDSGSLIANSTLSHNRASDNGGGVYQGPGTATTIEQSTIAHNSASDISFFDGNGGGVYVVPTGTLGLRNTIVASNSANLPGQDCAGPITSQDYNLIENVGGCTITGLTTHNLTNVDAKLAALADNGGGTYTHALLTDSPAHSRIPANLCPATDQRGVARLAGASCDIGAFEAYFKVYTPLMLR